MSNIAKQAQQLESGAAQQLATTGFGAADLAAEAGDWTVWMREKTVEALRNKDAEIKRLRGLLREGLDHHDEYNWQQRVREALGDER